MQIRLRVVGGLIVCGVILCGNGCAALRRCCESKDVGCESPCPLPKYEAPARVEACTPKAEVAPQKVIVEVRQLAAPPTPQQVPAAPTYAPQPQMVQAPQAMMQPMLMPAAYPQQAAVAAARPGLTFDFFHLPIPVPKFIAVPTAPEVPMMPVPQLAMVPQVVMQPQQVYAQPQVVVQQQPLVVQAPPVAIQPSPQQMAVVPVHGEALVPVQSQGVVVAPAVPALDPKELAAFAKQMQLFQAALDARDKAALAPQGVPVPPLK